MQKIEDIPVPEKYQHARSRYSQRGARPRQRCAFALQAAILRQRLAAHQPCAAVATVTATVTIPIMTRPTAR